MGCLQPNCFTDGIWGDSSLLIIAIVLVLVAIGLAWGFRHQIMNGFFGKEMPEEEQRPEVKHEDYDPEKHGGL